MSDNTKAKEMLKIIVNALEEKKAEGIKVLDIAHVTVLADYFIICNGTSKHQILALQDHVIEELAKAGFEPKNIEGKNGESWILMDYRDVIVHIFDSENREFYNLERLWQDGKEIETDKL